LDQQKAFDRVNHQFIQKKWILIISSLK
jgi:hypothetical protein